MYENMLMKGKMKVVSLITIPNEEAYKTCTLVLESIRIGFPNAYIEIWINGGSERYLKQIEDRIGVGGLVLLCAKKYHHAEWIKHVISDTEGELIIIDSDMIFWKEWKFTFPTLLAGYFVPLMWNDFAQCISYPRLHTSFLQISNCKELLKRIEEFYPMGIKEPEYAPLDMFMPSVKVAMNKLVFWDTCAVLYNAIGGTSFTVEHMDYYDHLNSAAFLNIMSNNMQNGSEFKNLHDTISRMPEMLKNRWIETTEYYDAMHCKALQLLGATNAL